MVLDTSAVVASVTGEPDKERYRQAMFGADSLAMSSVTVLETRIVLHGRHGSDMVAAFDGMIAELAIEVVAFDGPQVDAAIDAFRRYGKGQGHPAQLNLCDCAAYALAMTRNEGLLFKGNDFARTDIAAVL